MDSYVKALSKSVHSCGRFGGWTQIFGGTASEPATSTGRKTQFLPTSPAFRALVGG